MNTLIDTTEMPDATTVEMSDEEFAAIDIEPWQHEPDEWIPPTNERWAELANPHLMMIRVAWIVHYKTKPELIQMIEEMDDSGIMVSTFERMKHTLEWVEGLHTLLTGARARMLVPGMNAKG